MDSQIYEGNQRLVIEGTSNLINGNVSNNATANRFVYDNTRNLYVNAKAILTTAFGTSPTNQSTIDLFLYEQEIDGTNDVRPADPTDTRGGYKVGEFVMINTAQTQYQVITFSLLGVRKAEFAVENTSGATMSSGFTVVVEGFSPYEK